MARSRNPDGERLQGFPAGVNNVAPANDPPRDEMGKVVALREAVNVDLVGPGKKPRRRSGRTKLVSGRAHSPFSLRGGRHLFCVVDGEFKAFDAAMAPTTIRAGVGSRRLTYAQHNDDLYWSNGLELRRVRGADLADLHGWVDCPGVPQADAYDGGALRAGAYRVGMTWLDAEGRESGCAGLFEVEVADGQGIRVYDIPPAPDGAVTARVYLSAADSEELYAAADLSTLVTQTLITSDGDGRALETLWLRPLPPCNILRSWRGRLIGADGNLMVWSEAGGRVGLAHHDNYARFGQKITLLEPIDNDTNGAGVYVADHKYTYWMDGATPKEWRRAIKLDVPAVPGVSAVVKGTMVGLQSPDLVVVWLGANGVFYAGSANGQVQALTDGRLTLPGGEEGAMVFREYNGLRQLIASFVRTGNNSLAVGDRASATVTRHTLT